MSAQLLQRSVSLRLTPALPRPGGCGGALEQGLTLCLRQRPRAEELFRGSASGGAAGGLGAAGGDPLRATPPFVSSRACGVRRRHPERSAQRSGLRADPQMSFHGERSFERPSGAGSPCVRRELVAVRLAQHEIELASRPFGLARRSGRPGKPTSAACPPPRESLGAASDRTGCASMRACAPGCGHLTWR